MWGLGGRVGGGLSQEAEWQGTECCSWQEGTQEQRQRVANRHPGLVTSQPGESASVSGSCACLAKHALPHPTDSVRGGHAPQILKTGNWFWKALVNKPEPLTMLFSRFSPSFSFTGSISQGLWLWHIWKEHLRPQVSETDPRSSGGGGQQC